ncbi:MULTISPECIES: nucleotidyltransferase family protein [Nocardia]|uniref:MobA-like NTP transferase domain-containing protein n=2 Tax=Nocardia farcinica TaxID=37329 RepID=Q5YNZ4_NOCFA|nr:MULTISPECIES: nucleotidyltransferase family protein [Nocardia]AXK89699.1 nucleotidyltransferase family protein [Nocardia farcinica]MBA4857375.1 nucleotidyltransferase family protein [Nocardia farcinica]MBC9816923.1 nucleotidyltransferase family protein [Nocardia farcinica]MBF6071151.1 nucleotidyltransferase family protein [Nocardia farcinica]MBF6141228.1 nucleotidyltransferase family protein [Nocardia farcinica]
MAVSRVGIVLAAGAGTRYGRPKALAEGGAWLRSAIAALHGGGCERVVVVLGATGPHPHALDLPPEATPVWAPDWARGLSASLRAGLRAAAGGDYAVIMPVDTPDVGAAVVARVVEAALHAPSGLARAVFAGTPGHPVVMEHKHWAGALAMATADRGAGTYTASRSDMVCVTCDDLATGVDHDFPATAH